MRTRALILLGLVAASSPADPPAEPPADGRLNLMFAVWEQAAKGVRSLVIEYRQEEHDPVFHRVSDQYTCVFTLLRADDGGWLATLDCEPAIPLRPPPRRATWLLNHGIIYLLNPDAKVAVRFDGAAGDLPGVLARHFNPFVILLDRKRAEEWARLEVAKQDEWYTYLAVTPVGGTRSNRFDGTFDGGEVAVMAKDTADIPKGMPRALRHWRMGTEVRIDVHTWRLNPADPPKPAEFARPEDRPGWTVQPWPFQ